MNMAVMFLKPTMFFDLQHITTSPVGGNLKKGGTINQIQTIGWWKNLLLYIILLVVIVYYIIWLYLIIILFINLLKSFNWNYPWLLIIIFFMWLYWFFRPIFPWFKIRIIWIYWFLWILWLLWMHWFLWIFWFFWIFWFLWMHWLLWILWFFWMHWLLWIFWFFWMHWFLWIIWFLLIFWLLWMLLAKKKLANIFPTPPYGFSLFRTIPKGWKGGCCQIKKVTWKVRTLINLRFYFFLFKSQFKLLFYLIAVLPIGLNPDSYWEDPNLTQIVTLWEPGYHRFDTAQSQGYTPDQINHIKKMVKAMNDPNEPFNAARYIDPTTKWPYGVKPGNWFMYARGSIKPYAATWIRRPL